MTGLHVIESHVRNRDGGLHGGDAVVVTPHHAAVIDGVTGKTALHFDGLPADQFAARVIADALRTCDPAAEVSTVLTTLGAALTGSLAALGFDTGLVSPPAATVGIVALAREELWLVGDITGLLDGRTVTGGAPPTDAVLADLRAAYLHALLAGGANPAELAEADPSQALLAPMLEQQHVFGNHPDSPWSYGVLDGQPIPERHVHVHDLAGVDEVVLASDGFHVLHPTLAATLAAHEALVAADPLCIDTHHELRRCAAVGWDDTGYLRLTRSAG